MDLKKLLYKMLVKYYLSDNIKATFEDFALGLGNAWAGPDERLCRRQESNASIKLFSHLAIDWQSISL